MITLPAIEIGIPHDLREHGKPYSQLKVLDERTSAHSPRLQICAPASSRQRLFLRLNDPKIHLRIEGAEVSCDSSDLFRRAQAT
jgi:hypothetical protein